MKSSYDILMIGHVSKDIIIYNGETQHILGGPVIYSSASAACSGASVLVVTKAHPEDFGDVNVIMRCGGDLEIISSSRTTSIENIYHSEDRERRTVTLLSRADSFSLDEIPNITIKIYHLAGLFVGEIPDELVKPLSQRGKVALDAQGILRTELPGGGMEYRKWGRLLELLPFITFFKTDAAEAEFLTGLSNTSKAAEKLVSWGAQEVMVTHNTEVLIADREGVYVSPLRPKNLSGRTGRGDTTFAAYLAMRLHTGIQQSLDYAAALVSIKMETPGPFAGTMEIVYERMSGSPWNKPYGIG